MSRFENDLYPAILLLHLINLMLSHQDEHYLHFHLPLHVIRDQVLDYDVKQSKVFFLNSHLKVCSLLG